MAFLAIIEFLVLSEKEMENNHLEEPDILEEVVYSAAQFQ